MNYKTRTGFTLVELLVVIGIIALLMAILLPTLSKARQSAKTLVCLSQIRQLQTAQIFYANDNRGYFVQAGLGHGGHDDDHSRGFVRQDDDDDHHDEHGELDSDVSWLVALSDYAPEALVGRCPSDASPHWPDGVPVEQGDHDDGHDDDDDDGHDEGPLFRRTSYGINNYLSISAAPEGHERRWVKLTQIKNNSQVVQFLEMAETGPFAAADHPDLHELDVTAEEPFEPASEMLAIGMHGRDGTKPVPGPRSRANFGFIDGHAETRSFDTIYIDAYENHFNPELWFQTVERPGDVSR